ncbi:MAG: family 43 glycosylhydrolase [Clostridia bacterium]
MMINKNIRPGGGQADPHALVVGEKVYIFSGHDKSAKTEDTWRMDKWKIFSSDNLVDWKDEGDILPTDTYIGDQDHCWAGYITEKDGKYYWFFSNKFIDTGVLVSDSITGPFVDVKGAPVIPEGICPSRSYDPCVFEENGVHTIFFGAGTYYYATLADDMMSIIDEPKPLPVFDADGNKKGTEDKSTVFKYKGKYYLAFGSHYCMSDNLTGPYLYAGRFCGGGHNDVFEFKGKMYACNEFHDTNIFYRGIRVMELNFDENGKIIIDKDDELDAAEYKNWDFTEHDMKWFLTDMSDCNWTKDGFDYELDEKLGLRSPIWPGLLIKGENKLEVKISNTSLAKSVKIEVISIAEQKGYWNKPDCDENSYVIELAQDTAEHSYEINLITDTSRPTYIKKVTVRGTGDSGKILLKGIFCKKIK